MNKFAEFIVKHKILILCIFIAVIVASGIGMAFVNVNSDILSYIPEGLPMSDGMNKMQELFNMQGDAIIGVDNVSYDEMKAIVEEISKEKGIKEGGAIWIGTITEMADANFDLSQYQGMMDLMGIKFTQADFYDMVDQIVNNEDVYKFFRPQEDTFLIMLQLDIPTSSNEAQALIKKLEKEILVDYDFAIGGSSKITYDIFQSTIGEIGKYFAVAVLVMIIILLLTTTSLIEPVIFMLTLGVSILINMGTNVFLPSVSVVTYACSSILQLGLSMDYAIFLMHAFKEEQRKTLDDNLAMQRAIPKTFSTIASSALTTVGGFLALFFMQFEIGADLGIVLAKGVTMSLLSVIILQPCLMLLTIKWNKKTSHRVFLPKFKRVAGFSVNHRTIIVIIALLLIVPCAIFQSKVELSYVKFTDTPEEVTYVQEVVDSMSNSIIILVPDTKDTDKQYAMMDEIKKIDNISATLGVYSMVPQEYAATVQKLISVSKYAGLVGVDMGSMGMITNFAGGGYAMYDIMIDAALESPEADEALAAVVSVVKKYCGDDYYVTGMTQAVNDLRDITPHDFMMVTLVSIVIILIILLFALRSVKLSVLLVGLIELGIFLNLSICYIFSQSVNFMAYIIISSIQLGATVDYAILMTVKYQRYLKEYPAKEAAYRALTESGTSIMTSVAIMAGCCLSVSLVTSNRIVGEITNLIARGSIISGLLVYLLLPALMRVFTGNMKLKKKKVKEVAAAVNIEEIVMDGGIEEVEINEVEKSIADNVEE